MTDSPPATVTSRPEPKPAVRNLLDPIRNEAFAALEVDVALTAALAALTALAALAASEATLTATELTGTAPAS